MYNGDFLPSNWNFIDGLTARRVYAYVHLSTILRLRNLRITLMTRINSNHNSLVYHHRHPRRFEYFTPTDAPSFPKTFLVFTFTVYVPDVRRKFVKFTPSLALSRQLFTLRNVHREPNNRNGLIRELVFPYTLHQQPSSSSQIKV